MSTCRYPGDDLYLAAQTALDAWTRASRTTRVAVRSGFFDIGRHLLAECLTLEAAVPRAIGMRRAYAAGLADLAEDTRWTVADILDFYGDDLLYGNDLYGDAAGAARLPASGGHLTAAGTAPGGRVRPPCVQALGRAFVCSPLYPVEVWVERARRFVAAALHDDVWPCLSACGLREVLFRSLRVQIDQVEQLHAAQVRHGIAEACLGDTLAGTRQELCFWLEIAREAGGSLNPPARPPEPSGMERKERSARVGSRSVSQRSAAVLGRKDRSYPDPGYPDPDYPDRSRSNTDAPGLEVPDPEAAGSEATDPKATGPKATGRDALGPEAARTGGPNPDRTG